MSGWAKKRFLEALSSPHWRMALESLGEGVSRGLLSQALGALCSQEPQLRWRAVEAVGLLVSKVAAKDLEAAKEVVRRLLWSLNEESGSIGWGAPEALAEILARENELAKDFLPIFVSFLEPAHLLRIPPAIAQGFLWGVFRLGKPYREALGKPEVLQGIKAFLASPDPSSRGMALLALKSLGAWESLSELESLSHDREVFTYMEKGEVHLRSISQVLRP